MINASFDETDIQGIHVTEITFRRILGQRTLVYLTIPEVVIETRYAFPMEYKKITIEFDENQKVFHSLHVARVSNTPFLTETRIDANPCWYVKAYLKDFAETAGEVLEGKNVIIKGPNLERALNEMNSSPVFKYGYETDSLKETLTKVKPFAGNNFHFFQDGISSLEMIYRMIGIYNSKAKLDETIVLNENLEGIEGYQGAKLYDLVWLQAHKNNGELVELKGADIPDDIAIEYDYRPQDNFRFGASGQQFSVTTIPFRLNLKNYYGDCPIYKCIDYIKIPFPSFFKDKMVCEYFNTIRIGGNGQVSDWFCKIITLYDDHQKLMPYYYKTKPAFYKGKVTERNNQSPWLKVAIDNFDKDNSADVYLTSPYSGDGNSNKVGIHLPPEMDTDVLIKSLSDYREPLYFDCNLSLHPADEKPTWRINTLDFGLETLNIHSKERLTLKAKGVKADMKEGTLDVDEHSD